MSAAEVIKSLIRAKYDESPANRYPTEGALTDALLEGLKAAGYAVVELPKPNEYDEWVANDDMGLVWLSSRDIQIRDKGYAKPHQARELAAALLAAADAAEAS